MALVNSELETLRADQTRHRTLIEQLEADLAAATLDVPPIDPISQAGSPLPEGDDIFLLVDGSAQQQQQQQQQQQSPTGNPTNSVLAIVTAQRDRLKERLTAVEESKAAEVVARQRAEADLERARTDNAELVGQCRFLRNYTANKASGRAIVPIEAERRYAVDYERQLDPFNHFRAQERSRKTQNLSVPEKTVLGLMRWALSSSRARIALFVYALVMHLLVFGVLYRLAFTVDCTRGTALEWAEKFKRHMHDRHPGETDG